MIVYRSLEAYKYQLLTTYIHQTKIRLPIGVYIHEPEDYPMVSMSPSGMLTIHCGYCWDGPSGPTIDTKNFMRGSLVHDALYQLLRTSRLAQKWRKHADELIRDICREDGMSWLRSRWVYSALRAFGGRAARPQPEKQYEHETAP